MDSSKIDQMNGATKSSAAASLRELLGEAGQLVSLRLQLWKLNALQIIWTFTALVAIAVAVAVCGIAMSIELAHTVFSLLLGSVANEAQAHFFAFLLLLSVVAVSVGGVIFYLGRCLRGRNG